MDEQALSEDEIDELVESQADDDSAWGKPVKAERQKAAVAKHKRVTRLALAISPVKQ